MDYLGLILSRDLRLSLIRLTQSINPHMYLNVGCFGVSACCMYVCMYVCMYIHVTTTGTPRL